MRNYSDPQYTEWRKKVRARDKYVCRWPGCKCRKKLQAHHIKKWADNPVLRFQVSNGITLCKQHHTIVNGNEEMYAPILMKILWKS